MADRVGQAVGAQQVAIPLAGLPHDQCGLHLVTGQRLHDQGPLGVAVRLLGGDAPLVDQGLDEGVVLGDLVQLTVAKQIPARIPDVHQPEPIPGEQDRGQRGAHAVELGVDVHLLGDRRITFVDRAFQLAEQVATGLVVVEMSEGRDHQLGGHFAGCVPAHSIGEGQQPGSGVDGVLIVGADQAAVAARGVTQGEGHGRSSITVLPTCTGVPMGTRTAVVTLDRSR